jgi:methyltransferase (TIGR00027 family)
VRWIEVDHPSTQLDKRRRLSSLGVGLDHVSFAAVDLMTDDLDTALSVAGHATEAPTLFICEGLLAYLPLDTSRSLCRTLRERSHADSILAANFRIAPTAGLRGRSLRRAVDAVLAAMGEHRRTDFRPGDPEDLLAESGWTIVRQDRSTPSRADGGSHLLVLAAMPSQRP